VLAKRCVSFGTQHLQVTLSCGLSEPADPGDSVQADRVQLVRRADDALYAAKRAGRDRVYYHDGQQCVLWRRSGLAEPVPSTSPQSASR
jgi:diguanylate cyclase